MMDSNPERPLLRGVEARPYREDGQTMVALHDPAGLAGITLSVSLAALQVLSLMDGTRTPQQICESFGEATGQTLSTQTLETLLGHLGRAHLLEGPAFERHYAAEVEAYRAGPARTMNDLAGLGLEGEEVSIQLDELFGWDPPAAEQAVVGIIAPHLDYPRGLPCYHQAYAALADRRDIERFVILGTNHFGRAEGVVATSQDFQTPLGTATVDREFLRALEQRAAYPLHTWELDHRREHSVELQVLLLQHLLGTDGFDIVPLLCPDPCLSLETEPGFNLRTFAETLGDLMREDPRRSCVVAGADLSHVGSFFGDEEVLSEPFLQQVRGHDQAVLQRVAAGDAEGFRQEVARDGNPTRICSAGCIFTLMTALPGTQARLLHYHQAVNHEAQCTVTCAAALFETA